MRHLTTELDGKKIAYTDETHFLIQVGKGKGSYRTQYDIVGNLEQAVMHYNCINIRSPYKKRLIFVGANKPLLARAIGT